MVRNNASIEEPVVYIPVKWSIAYGMNCSNVLKGRKQEVSAKDLVVVIYHPTSKRKPLNFSV